MSSGTGTIRKTLNQLHTHGWITLRSMSPLLGYTHATGVYRRQAGKHPIAAIRIGGTYRVYTDTVIDTLENAPERDQEASQIILSLFRSIQKGVKYE